MLDALIERGLQFHRTGRLDEARSIYDQVLATSPRHPDALHLRGLVSLQCGDPGSAVGFIRKAAQIQPRNWVFKGNLASALMSLGDFAQALSMFRRAAQLSPDDPQYPMGIANCHALLREFAEAEKQLRAITQRFPDFALAWFNLANAVRDQQRVREAVELYRHAIALDRNLVEAHINLGGALLSLGKLELAEASFRQALDLQPGNPQLICNLASVLIDRGKFAEAEAQCRLAISCAPEMANAYSFLGAAIGHQGRLLEALKVHQQAAALAPNDVKAIMALGTALFEVGNTAEAIPMLQRALELAPDLWQAHVSLGTTQLAAGNFVEGWKGYYRRAGRTKFVRQYPDIAIAESLPAPLEGATVCLLNEQGLGDQLFLLRWLAELKARGATVAYRPDPKMEGILKRVPMIDRFVRPADALPDADACIMLGDLPYLLCHGPDSTPAPPRALVPPSLALTPLPDRLARIKERLLALGPPPYIGVTWRGGTPPDEQTGGMSWQLYKETPIEQLAAALTGTDGTFLALQRKPRAGEIRQLSALLHRPLHDLTDLNDALEDMLALLAVIDEYVGVSNTNMHLRAGTGRTARVLVPCPPEWRWMASGDESPWFPGFRVYRQNNDGGWGDALGRLSGDLQAAFPPRA